MKMKKPIFLSILIITFCMLLESVAQWSRDPGEALNLPDIPHGYIVTTDSLGGVFVIGADWDYELTYSRTYCTYLDRGGEYYWDRWVAFMPGVDFDRASGPFVCSEPGYLIAVLFVKHHTDEDTLWEIRAQKVSIEGETMWSDSGVSVSSRWLPENLVYTEMIGAESDGEGGLIILWTVKYYRDIGGGNIILERQSFRAQRLSSDGEALWGDNGIEVVPDVNGRDAINGKVVSDGAGGVIMVYYQGGTESRVIGAQRISFEGERLWGDSGIHYELNSYLFIGDAVSDNHGGVIFSGKAAQDERWQVRVFRLDQDGDQLFGDGNGVVVKDVHYRDGMYLHYNWVTQASDSVFFMNWKGDGDEEPLSLVQAVNLEGELIWEWPGLIICDADTAGHTMRGVSSFNSVIYGWYGYRPSEERVSALYCQRLDEQGNRLWADEGVMLFDRRGMEITNILPDGYGGAIFKISRYLQHINRNGELGVTLTIRSLDQPLAPGIIEYSLFPNPTNGAATITFLTPSITERQVILFDLEGRMIFQDLIPSGVSSYPIDISAYPSGSYILQVLPGVSDSYRILNIIK
jgi:hypothetical protein